MTCPTISGQLGCPGWPHTPKNHFQTASASPAPLPAGHTLHATHRITVNSKEQNARAVLYIHSKTQCFCGTGNAEGPGASAPASQRDARHGDTLVPHPSACTGRSIPSSSHTAKNLMCKFRNFKLFILSHKEAEPLAPNSTARLLPPASATVKSLYHFPKLHRLTLLFLGRASVFAVCP